MTFENSSRNAANFVAMIFGFGFAGLSYWIETLMNMGNVLGWIFFAIGLLIGIQLLVKLIVPYTVLLEFTETCVRFGNTHRANRTKTFNYLMVDKFLIDADEGEVWLVDLRGKRHRISDEILLSKADFADIKEYLERQVGADKIIFRSFDGVELCGQSSRKKDELV